MSKSQEILARYIESARKNRKERVIVDLIESESDDKVEEEKE